MAPPPPPEWDPAALLGWAAGRRDHLPWRGTRDPWAVLVSESMLQQTQVDRVVPRWWRFMERFPTVAACADAGVGAVIEEWAGLGYNRRAVNLHRCAVEVRDRHDAAVPDDLGALLALPGIGPYTARAILAFAFEHDVAVLDTNVGRVLARQSGERLRPAEAQRVADGLVPHGEGWAWNQAMLDLGALVCGKRSPQCTACPVATSCAWWNAGRPDPDPAVGSAGVGRGQSRFEGSFRQGRARLLDVVRLGDAVPRERFVAGCGWTDRVDGDELARRAADSLLADGLVVETADGSLALP